MLKKAVFLFDGECEFCLSWVKRWARWTGESVVYRPYQEALREFTELRESDCERAVHLIERDGQVYQGAEAIFRVLKHRLIGRILLWSYLELPGFSFLVEGAYQWVSRNRRRLGWFA